jgi:SRSO17 transposase
VVKRNRQITVREFLKNAPIDGSPVIGRRREQWQTQYEIYIDGQILPGARKSMQPMAGRVEDADYQQMQQFITDSPWDSEATMNGIIDFMKPDMSSSKGIIAFDDTGFPKHGVYSVGVGQQYSGAIGKLGNCQVSTSALYILPSKKRNRDAITWPLGMRLFLLHEWIDDKNRRDNAGIPDNIEYKEKWRLALELLDNAVEHGIPHCAVTADSAYGASTEFRSELRRRKEPYVLAVSPKNVSMVLDSVKLIEPEKVRSRKFGRMRMQFHLPDGIFGKDVTEIAQELAEKDWKDVCWSEGSKGKLHRKFAKRKVRVLSHGRECTDEICWLLLEQDAGELKSYFCWGFNNPSLEFLVRISRARWFIEQGYREMKEELGLDHFEGRSWKGWNHHAVLTQIAYAYLAWNRFHRNREDKKDPLLTLPEIRRQVVKEMALKLITRYFGVGIGPELEKGKKRFSDILVKMT